MKAEFHHVIVLAALLNLASNASSQESTDPPHLRVTTSMPPEPIPIRDVFFSRNSHTIRPDQISTLTENVHFLKRFPRFRLRLEGHADNRGTAKSNGAIAYRRANAVRSYLIQSGIEPHRIDIVSLGEDRPYELGHEDESLAKNRRVHFLLLLKK